MCVCVCVCVCARYANALMGCAIVCYAKPLAGSVVIIVIVNNDNNYNDIYRDIHVYS